MTSNASPSSFYRDELSRALQEQGEAIISYRLMESSLSSASAEVQLLEANSVIVALSLGGYRLVSQVQTSMSYETVEPLLASVSPLYGVKKDESLLAKLNALAQTGSGA
ncbi:hypothetical protein CALVIDRAFT_554662 [Calocera viscosa TUFC12733]|uniref:GSKIP domain-containing protein n=1 Tax=Calocera viscosa (strain TUFC12733) TaxID=1330018 RepID=A0A167MS51_CALVF|nr:hypothetical protein CALVIDRAFT_554662 [Calocera viscosa TUFC12733]